MNYKDGHEVTARDGDSEARRGQRWCKELRGGCSKAEFLRYITGDSKVKGVAGQH